MSLGLIYQEKNRVLRVTELNLAIKQLIESNVPMVWVRGEISNLVKATSGHFYFSLKDAVTSGLQLGAMLHPKTLPSVPARHRHNTWPVCAPAY